MSAPRWIVQVRPSRRSTTGECETCHARDCEQPDTFDVGRTHGGLFFDSYGRAHTRAKALALAEAHAADERRRFAEYVEAERKAAKP